MMTIKAFITREPVAAPRHTLHETQSSSLTLISQ